MTFTGMFYLLIIFAAFLFTIFIVGFVAIRGLINFYKSLVEPSIIADKKNVRDHS
jgi:hypothetical protein